MKIAKHTVVSFDYVLTDDGGAVIDSSTDGDPLVYLHGGSGIIPGLERALDGKVAGDELQVAVASQDGYGERKDELRQRVPREQFQGDMQLEVGMQFRVDTEGGPMIVQVVEVDDESVVVDGNHPLAGIDLNFAVTIREVREATSEEIDHGHVHGPGGHHH